MYINLFIFIYFFQQHFVHATALERTLSTSDLNFIHQKLLYNSEQITPAQVNHK